MQYCQLTLRINGELLATEWSYKETFDDFLRDAIQKHPDVDRICLYWGGDEMTMHQGDLLYGIWEKHDGKWYRVDFSMSSFFPPKEMVLYPELNEVPLKIHGFEHLHIDWSISILDEYATFEEKS